MKKFLRQSVHKKVRLAPKWRRPKGRQSKKRLVHAGHSKGVSSGYGLSKSEKGKVNGKEVVMVSSLKDLETIKSDSQVIIVASTVGAKKKVAILTKCKEAKVEVLNIKDADAYVKSVEAKLAENKKKKQAKAAVETKKPKAKKEEASEKAEEKPELAESEPKEKPKAKPKTTAKKEATKE